MTEFGTSQSMSTELPLKKGLELPIYAFKPEFILRQYPDELQLPINACFAGGRKAARTAQRKVTYCMFRQVKQKSGLNIFDDSAYSAYSKA